MVFMGIDENCLMIKGFGEIIFILDNIIFEGKVNNCCVEFKII